jgi:hypothetical protein
MAEVQPLSRDEIAKLVEICQRLKAENAVLRSQATCYDTLREIACDPAVPPHIRLKAAEAGVGYERPKLSANMTDMRVTSTGIARKMELIQKKEDGALLKLDDYRNG